jgi:hypothetical protein
LGARAQARKIGARAAWRRRRAGLGLHLVHYTRALRGRDQEAKVGVDKQGEPSNPTHRKQG